MNVPDRVGVYGGGRMGAGIAHAFLTAGSTVTVVESDEAASQSARDRVATSLDRAAERGLLHEDPPSALARLTTTTDPTALAESDLVIEAVPEDVALKGTVLGVAASHAPKAALATNTSSLSIDHLARDLPDPSRLIGLHFFNPVPASDLIEIVVGAATSPALVTEARDWAAALGKTAITVTDSPGFASSRLGVALALEAMRMLEEGVASAEDIDTAMTLGYRHPTGPLRTTDLVGLDVRLAIAEHLERELGPRFAPPAILREKVEAGHLGRKTGRGFFTW
ncbi:3-hydroxyacyl-CoA dehydrogenase [Actinomadura pelletieri DSM 43383]|uniref:3-hydroxyacyl-CoA dehydrogenase n=1 Tax=Actinomadura pelletieri DSM 43383 TaxID=1120940 RepID=A0A495QKY3_9ACTN|nr:3-hydroxyacyl-CoA dehydrogenase family protein [Actinomadura pelletieri]RKS73168.1 3-hydroxyacyl-CoA dehydrogenase [Actinomadura pelletieri DSM 43383]